MEQSYYDTEQWQTVKRQRLSIDKYRCQMCGCAGSQRNPLTVHHLSYKHFRNELQGDAVYSDLVTLCSNCHNGVHSMMNRRTSADGKRGWSDSLKPANHIYETGTGTENYRFIE